MAVDIYYPTSILRPVYYYTVPSSARSGVRGTQRPANIVYYTVPYWKCLYSVMLSSSHIHSAYCTCTYMYRRTCANARVVSYVSRTGTAIHIFTGNWILVCDWSPYTNILSLRYLPSKVSSIHLPYHHNVNKFVLIVSNFAWAKFSQHLLLSSSPAPLSAAPALHSTLYYLLHSVVCYTVRAGGGRCGIIVYMA